SENERKARSRNCSSSRVGLPMSGVDADAGAIGTHSGQPVDIGKVVMYAGKICTVHANGPALKKDFSQDSGVRSRSGWSGSSFSRSSFSRRSEERRVGK